jgi:hypothetical protein
MSDIETLSAEEFARLEPQVNANQARIRELPNGMPSAEFRAAMPFPDIGNAEAGKVEQYRLRRDKPDAFGAYLSGDGRRVTTWTGDTLGFVMGIPRRSSDNRVTLFSFRMDGRDYHARGAGYGMYCGCKAYKGKVR